MNKNIIINSWASSFFMSNLSNESPIEYLKTRNISLETCKKLKIGFWPMTLKGYNTRKVLYELLKSKSLTDKELKDCSLLKYNNSIFIDIFPLSIVFPIYNNGSIVQWYLRGIDPLGARKHHNTTGKKYLFNEKAIKNDDTLIVCEGPFDCASLVQLGYNAVSTLGTFPSEGAITALRRHKDIIICYDTDENNAGQKASRRLAFQLITKGCKVKIASLPHDGKSCDINQLLVDRRTGELARAIGLSKDYSKSKDFGEMELSYKASQTQRIKSKYKIVFNRDRINRVKAIGIKTILSNYTCMSDDESILMRCIFDGHNDSNPSFHVKNNSFICYGCGKRGDLIQLVRDKEELSFWGAIQHIEENYCD